MDHSLALVLLLLAHSVHAQLPYHPTRVFRSSKHDGLVYVFGPAPSAPNQAQLRSLDVTASLDPATLNYNTLYSTLPWSSAADATPYIPVVEADGNFTVYAGACTDTAQDAKTWTFEIDGGAEDGNGTWSQADIVLGDVGTTKLLAPSFLAGGLSFSSSEDGSNSSLFVFGGMCPYAAATQDEWQGSANYSNTMLQLAPDSATQYSLNVAPTRGPPVAEAGFALVGLPPTYSSGDQGSRDQQQNFVLIGGHTQTAYINMSQVALYSLPQETWTYLGVDQPTQEHTDLVRRDQATEVEPRSGHTALLTADGSKIIVFGGWVGDIDTPADPQLAILNVGEGYGGDGSWQWTIPTTTGSGLTNGGGIYGHGAVMLSGDVMMVAGGYSISSGSSRLRSRADLAQNTQSFFFNVTSNTWLSEYQPNSESSDDSSSDSSPSKAGLGAGLGIGLAAVLAMTVFYFWYKRYLRKKREIREKQVERDLSRGGHGFQGNESYDNGGNYADYLNDREAAALAVDPWFLNSHQGWKNQQSQEAERTGLLVEIPSPTRGLRRSLNGRAYHQAPRYDESRMNQGSGGIHPIDEEDEVESVTNERTGMPEMSERPRKAEDRFSTLSSASYTPTPGQDPFLDPDPLRSHPVPLPQNVVHFPTSLKSSGKQPVIQPGPMSLAQARIADVRSASPNWELVANGGSSSGRSNPESSERTESNLSDQSARSALSMISARSGAASVARTLSNASAAIMATFANPFTTPNASPVRERHQLSIQIPPGQSLANQRSGESIGNGPRTNADDDSFKTAKSSFAKLQAEGEALLGGRPQDVDDLPGPSHYPSSPSSDKESPNQVHTPIDFYPEALFEQSKEDNHNVTPLRQDPETLRRLTHAASSDTLDLSTPVDNSFATQDRSKSWIRGSVRLALARRPSSSHRHSNSHDRAQSLTSSIHRRRRHTNEDDGSGWFGNGGAGNRNSGTNSPTKLRRHRRSGSGVGIGESTSGSRPSTGGDNPNPPRRANSDASFWKSKRGSKAWTDDPASPMWPPDKRDEGDWAVATPDPGQGRESLDGAYGEGEDWDVEAAAEGRVVQVMFTVPRQPLRVVNVDSELGSGETSDEARSSRVPSGSKGKQRVERLGTDDESISSSPAAIAAAEDLISDHDRTPTAKGKAKATLQPPLKLAPPPRLRPHQARVTSSSPPPDMQRPGSLPDLQPLHKPPPVSPAFPPPDSEDEEQLIPPPSLSQLSKSSGVTSNNTAASLISPYGANPQVSSSSTLGTTITAPETPTPGPMRGRPSEKNLRELRKERERTRSRSRGRGLLTPPANRQPLERPGLGERSKSKTSVRSEGGGSVKDLIKEIELRNRS
ncbi:galactose oxidase kelch beta-propeller [Diplodia corticola]|uniref:Galactose oxidase kelch beta-propeller n=1 Tax=Diplodia corticola TaxID=236234 RepID=A0A1J9RL44_9PEZI|nr:galactose oxidase kelch beta-propeller [Diplodia corticola]OJD29231.1 galactose oxidase kelch beta-propeller [Diplodia corticola]